MADLLCFLLAFGDYSRPGNIFRLKLSGKLLEN